MNAITRARIGQDLRNNFSTLQLVSSRLNKPLWAHDRLPLLGELARACDAVTDDLDELFDEPGDTYDSPLAEVPGHVVPQQWAFQPESRQPT